VGQGSLRELDGAKEVDIHDLTDDFDAGGSQQAAMTDAGIVDEAVDAAEVTERRG